MKDYSNYHNINTHEKIKRDGLLLLEQSLNGFESYEAIKENGQVTRVLIYQKYDADSDTKNIIGHVQDVEYGSSYVIDGVSWLVITLPEDNKIYRKADMKICNSFFPAITDKTRVLKRNDQGEVIYNKLGDPVFIETGGEQYDIPCIVESGTLEKTSNSQLNLPDGRIKVTMKCQSIANVKVNEKFKMYDNTYKIVNIDKTKAINNVGLMIITADIIPSEVIS